MAVGDSIQAGRVLNIWAKFSMTGATNARPEEGEDVVQDPTRDYPYRVFELAALRLPEIRRLPGGMAWFESGPAVVNRYARVQVRSPFGVLVRDQWSYV